MLPPAKARPAIRTKHERQFLAPVNFGGLLLSARPAHRRRIDENHQKPREPCAQSVRSENASRSCQGRPQGRSILGDPDFQYQVRHKAPTDLDARFARRSPSAPSMIVIPADSAQRYPGPIAQSRQLHDGSRLSASLRPWMKGCGWGFPVFASPARGRENKKGAPGGERPS